jgi:SAM-dependent methyltransferase/GNAT superfamily N-acetyltransferase
VYIRVQWATEPSDREEVFRFRYRVAWAEAGRPPDSADHGRGWIRDDLDELARILVAVDDSTGAVLGTTRAVFGCDRPFSQALADELDASSMIVAFGDARLCHSGMFMVDPAYRGQTVASQLMAGLVRAMLDHGVDVDLCRVDLPQARSWFQLGYRPYGSVVQASHDGGGELQIPLALVLRDHRYLTRTGSPLAPLVNEALADDATAQRLRELYPHFEDQLVTPQGLGAFWASVAHAAGAMREASLFDGIAQDRLDALLRDLPSVRVGAGRPLPPGGEHERGLGLLLRGRLGLTMEQGERPFFVSVLQAGEVFGSLGSTPTTPPSAGLVALEDTELLVLKDELLEGLDHSDPDTAQRLRHNLQEILAQRLDATNRQVAGFMRGSPERVPISAEPDTRATATTPMEPAPSGYDEAELLEAELLDELELDQASTILELGADYGHTSLLLARLFPAARVVGVEPDPERSAQAERLATAAGLEEHCTFMVGQPERIPLDNGIADAAYARMLMQRLPAPLAALRELRRVVRPGGVIAVLDTDDGGLMIHPEPPGLEALLARVADIRAQRGGDRRVGRRLPDLLQRAGLEEVRVRVLTVGPERLALPELLEHAFAHHEPLLRSAGVVSPEQRACIEALAALPRQPGAMVAVPLILAWGRVPSDAPPY